MSKKKTAKNQNSKPVQLPISDNLVDTSAISANENSEMNPDEILLLVEIPEISEVPENTEPIVEEVSLETIAETSVLANENDLKTVEPVAESSNVTYEEAVVVSEINVESPIEVTPVTIEGPIEHVAEGNVLVIEEVIPAQEAKPKKSAKTKQAGTSSSNTVERIKLVGTSYHYFRNFLKYLFRENEITSAKFIKDEVGWKGYISIPANVKEPALKVLAQYQIDNPDTKTLWWEVIVN